MTTATPDNACLNPRASQLILCQIDDALHAAWFAIVEAMRKMDLPEELPADHTELEKENPELYLLVSYSCFLKLAMRDLTDGSIAERPETYEDFRTDDYQRIKD